MSCLTAPSGNLLIAALAPADLLRWLPDLEWVDMPLGKVLYESGSAMDYVWFPVTAIVSLFYVTEGGASSELAVVGNEGLVGVSLFMGGGSTPSRGVVQAAGEGFRMSAHKARAHFERDAQTQFLLLRYTQSLITQMSLTAVCNRHHSLDEQLCKRLLLSLDRVPGRELLMTQELIASMLGVRREGVTAAALKLQRAGLIRYARGCIEVLDRPALERRSCECYGVVKRECDRLLPETMAMSLAQSRSARNLQALALSDAARAAKTPPSARAARQGTVPSAARTAALRAASLAVESARTALPAGRGRTGAQAAGADTLVAMSGIVSGWRTVPDVALS